MKKLFIIMIVGIVLLSGCKPAVNYSESLDMAYQSTEAPPFAPMAEEAFMGEEEKASYAAGTNVDAMPVERLIIKNATLGIAVEDPVASIDAIYKLAEDMGGFLVTSNVYKTTLSSGVEVPRGSITIRVPAEKLDEAMGIIKAMVADPKNGVLNESVSGQDVTAEFTDSQARLRNLEAAEAQLVDLLNSATDLEYVLEVFRELTSIRSQIEVLEGRIKYLSEAAALSSISVDVIGESSLQPIEIGGWKPQGIAKDAIQALIKALQGLGTVLIWFGLYCLHFLIPLGFGVFFLVKIIWKACAMGKAKKAL
ncbi:MAG: DUF4349 domain-containing protein, partial [Anaerolineaceae bacterium]|nr:DUF4349 domain-containing protein [Anaerolineaceae bacterium]